MSGTGENFVSESVITTRDLTKVFGHFTAVDSLNLDIRSGELFGLLGPNGAGKTTTVRMLCTLLEPTRGTATVAGYDLIREPSKVRRQIGVVSDGVSLYKDMTIQENLNLLSRLYDLPKRVADRRMQELLDMFNFKEKATRLVKELSTGMTKKVLIMAALLHSPKVLFLDEVTSGLDPQSAIALRDFTRKLCNQGVTVIWTTHYMQEPEKICDRVGVIFEGRLIQIGAPNELRRSVNELSVLEVEAPNLDGDLIEKIQNLDDVCKVTYNSPTLQLTFTRNEDLPEIVTKMLVSSGVKVRRVNNKEPTLEEAFISLTGGEEEIDRFLEKSRERK
jgi:ABC-2 type transport system ATP-binding protein